MSRLRRSLPWIWTGLVVLAAGAMSVVALRSSPELTEFATGALVVLFAVLLTVLGALIGTRQPGNRISWIFYVTGTGILLTLAVSPIIEAGPPASPTTLDLLAVFASHTAVQLIFYPLFLLLYIFPTGRFPSRRWRSAGWVGWAALPLLLLSVVTDPIQAAFEDWAIENPFGFIPPPVFDWASIVWFNAFVVVAIGSIPAIAMRYRASSDLVRAQIRWLIFAAFIAVLSFSLTVMGVGDGDDLVGGVIFISLIAPVPIAVTMAITRYKLFEIDRIISRTVSYAVVVGLLAVVFAAGVTWIPSALELGDSPLLVAGSTLAVAALFNPLRKRVQHAVDKRFNRSRYQAELVSDQFATRLRESLTVDELAEVWTETVDQHLQPESSGVWLREA